MTPKASLDIFPAETCLVQSLVTELCSQGTRDLSKLAVILPTQRLGTQVLARVARQLGAFRPPKVLTLEALLNLSKDQQTPRPVTEAAADFILRRLIDEGQFQQLRLGHERELRLLLGEMYDNRISTDAFEKARQALELDVYHDGTHTDSLTIRVRECQEILERFEALLSQEDLILKQGLMATLSCNTQKNWRLDAYERVYLVGYTSVAPSWLPALRNLCQNPNLHVWLSCPPDIYHGRSPLENLLEFFQAACGTVNKHQSHSPSPPPVQLLELENPFAELAYAHGMAMHLLKAGHQGSQIGVIITSEGVYEPIFNSLNQTTFENSNIAMTRPFRKSTVGTWLEKLLTLLQEDQLSAWLDWLRDPYTTAWLEGIHEVSIDALVWNLSRSKASSIQQFLADSPESEALLDSINQVVQDLCSGSRTLESWAAQTLMWIHRCFPRLEQQQDQVVEVLEGFQETIQQVSKLIPASINRGEYFDFLRSHLLNADLRSLGEPLEGIQIISLAEARYYPFSAAIILGCNEGQFPKALPRDELFDNYLKKQMGLPGWEVLEAMEDQTFHLLKARLPQLFLLRSKTVQQQSMVRSRFIEKLASENRILHRHVSFSPRSFWQERQHLQLEPIPPTELELEGQLGRTPNSLWGRISASRLESLMRCPYQYLMKHLGIRSLSFPRPDDPRLEGDWLHQVLESFFRGRIGNDELFTWTPEDLQNFETIGMERLERLTLILGPPNITKKPIYFQLLQHSWPAFLGHIKTFYQESLASLNHGLREARLNHSSSSNQTLRVRGIPRAISGSIDSLDLTDDLVMLTDYKRKTLPTGKQVQSALSPQLAFYGIALQYLRPDISASHLMVGYWNILKGEWQPHGVGDKARSGAVTRGLASNRLQDLNELLTQTLEAWCWREEDVEDQNRFYADPSACGLCDYADLCRKDDPRHRHRIQNQKAFSQYQEGQAHD